VRVSTLWWQQDERDTRPWTAPEIAAELGFEDYRTNTDAALKAILEYVPQKSLTQLLTEAATAIDFKAAAEVYRRWRNEPANKYRNPETAVNNLGYQFLGKKQFAQAIEIFKLNVEAFPQSANAYDSLAEAYMTAGNKELAIKNYEKALELDPNMASAQEALRKLRGN
jgi:tetratricopeptide (TPR) repeat protein